MERLAEQILRAQKEREKMPIWFQNDMELNRVISSKNGKSTFPNNNRSNNGNGKIKKTESGGKRK